MEINPIAALNTPAPLARLLSNGRYHVLITAAGGGQSQRLGLALNRWSGDAIEDAQGYFLYLRDLNSSAFWSLGYQPVKPRSTRYHASHTPGCFTLIQEHQGIEARLDVSIAAEQDLEIRRIQLRNLSTQIRRIELTSYLEVVLNHPMADAAHPAFSKLFVQTESLPEQQLLLARRRPRSNEEVWPWMFHALYGANELQWETDRLRFIGRGRTPARPAALVNPGKLSGTTGNVLDPIFSLRTVVELAPDASTNLVSLTGMADDRDTALQWAAQYRDSSAVTRVYAEAESAERALWQHLDVEESQAERFQLLGGALAYGSPRLNPVTQHIAADWDVDTILGRYGIPPDRPLLVVAPPAGDAQLAELLKARAYWGAKGWYTNLVVIHGAGIERPPGLDDRVYFLNAETLPFGDAERLLAIAAIVVRDALPVMDEAQGDAPTTPASEEPPTVPVTLSHPVPIGLGTLTQVDGLQLFNGFGGFSADGSEYVIRLAWNGHELKRPPLPWINVLANEQCGCLVSEAGAGYTWSRNSQANRLTPWSNDPVSDPHTEAIYIRDEATGRFWSPLPGPAPAACDYEVRHGFGYSCFACTNEGLAQQTTMFVPRNDTLRIVRLRLTNREASSRRVSVFAYQHLLMGTVIQPQSRIVTDYDAQHDVLMAENPTAKEFRGGIAFAFSSVKGTDLEARHFSCNRAEFIGRHGSLHYPAALRAGHNLKGACGAGINPCFAEQLCLTVAPGETVECAFLFGEVMSKRALSTLIQRFRDFAAVDQSLVEVQDYWRTLMSGIRIETPAPAIDLMVNGWLPYQNLVCRIWARSAFYQSGGAYGYRDQLQDAAALVYLQPGLTRKQILKHARHQFEEGDVQHWWHPQPIDRGLRTRFSDDLLWLPYVTVHYIKHSGDQQILDETMPFLTARTLAPGEDEAYLEAEPTASVADLYTHCTRALDRGLTRGEHGLPLMGTGDWNDGMNRVGRQGRGESIWLGFFIYHILEAFLTICVLRSDAERVAKYSKYQEQLAEALNDAGWDGHWYRRAYYDDGQPLGTQDDEECRIDALAQAWAVMSKVAPPERAQQAMEALTSQLISERDGIIRLLTPPFMQTPQDPGYIKGYVAGVRENGGQYTHAACWVVRALAEAGERNLAAHWLERLSPISHALDKAAAERFKVEPYVITADVYGEPPHVGRGGWSWYTGAAGWYYRVALESILGFRIENGNTLVLQPCIPDDWPGYRLSYRHPDQGTIYDISLQKPEGKAGRIVAATLDGVPLVVDNDGPRIPLLSDGQRHSVSITMA